MNARKAKAPCGHPGTHVTNTFISCDLRCGFSDGVPEPVDEETTQPLCIHCGSADLAPYPGMKYEGKQLYHCNNCELSTY